MSLNIIVKKTPPWRKNQPRLGTWNSKHKDGHSISGHLDVKEQFDKSERLKIDNACRATTAMGSQSLSDPMVENVEFSVEDIKKMKR